MHQAETEATGRRIRQRKRQRVLGAASARTVRGTSTQAEIDPFEGGDVAGTKARRKGS